MIVLAVIPMETAMLLLPQIMTGCIYYLNPAQRELLIMV